MITDKPVLVTGASGFIGRYLAERLVAQGVRVRLLVRDVKRLDLVLRENAEIYLGDLEVPDSLRPAVKGVGRIFHCAANVKTWDSYVAYERVNVLGLSHLLDAIATSESLPDRFVHVSTMDVYGFSKSPCNESDKPRLSGFAYGDSKLRGECLLRERANTMGLNYVVLRPANVMGPRSPFIDRMGDELRSGLMLRIDGGQANCGFLAVDNLVDCLLWAAEARQAVGEVFNVRDPANISWAQFIRDFRVGIKGRGIVISLPYWFAQVVAKVLAIPYSLLKIYHEPLLHPLIVKIFGRTCGHRIDKLIAAGAPVGRVSYAETMAASVEWYLDGE